MSVGGRARFWCRGGFGSEYKPIRGTRMVKGPRPNKRSVCPFQLENSCSSEPRGVLLISPPPLCTCPPCDVSGRTGSLRPENVYHAPSLALSCSSSIRRRFSRNCPHESHERAPCGGGAGRSSLDGRLEGRGRLIVVHAVEHALACERHERTRGLLRGLRRAQTATRLSKAMPDASSCVLAGGC